MNSPHKHDAQPQTAATHPRFADPTETMPRADLERMQEALVLQLIPYAYGRSALVREVWGEAGITPADIGSLADFREKVPFIDKDRIRRFRNEHNDPFGGLRCADPPHMRGVGFTSGTTGDATPCPYSDQTGPSVDLKRCLWHIGVRPGDYFTYMMFTFRGGHMADQWADVGFRPLLFQHHPGELPRVLQASRSELQPKAFFMLSTPMVLALEDLARKQSLNLREIFSCYRGAVFGGEPLGGRIREVIRSWNLEVFEYTSLGDICGAMECRAHQGLHTWEDLALVEHLNPDHDSTEQAPDGGRGELVVTSLMDDVAPLIRFRTDDLITFTRGTCPCGRTHGRMTVIGRKGDEILVQGRSVLPRDLMPVLEKVPETTAALFQIIRTSREVDKLRLRIGFDPETLQATEAELAGRLTEIIVAHFEVEVSVELIPNAELLKLGPPQKIPRVAAK
jgi:phenylacetate-CoA ligase